MHGYVELEWCGNILIIRPKGPFNIEGVTTALNEIKSAAQSSSFEHWRRLEYLDKDAIGSPEVMASVRDSYQWSLANGCIGIAIVSNNQLQKNLLAENPHPAIKTFDDKDAALQWLDELSAE